MSDDDAPASSAAPEPPTLHGVPTTDSPGVDAVLFPDVAGYLALMRTLADDGFHMPVDLTVVDYVDTAPVNLPVGVAPGRFELVVHLRNLVERRFVRVRVQLPADEPAIPSLYDLYPGTEAMEREAYDMFGVVFEGHPDLTRILMPETWEGHPLRKDYDPGTIPVQFKEANS